jgi:ribosomal protein S18 acetylase RimI-like enzyme
LTVNRDTHLNLVESSRRLFELDPGAEIEAGPGWVLGAGRSSHPLISNAAFRTDDGLDPEELIALARDFFGERGRGFALWARAGAAEDDDLIAVAEAAGLESAYEMPEMVLPRHAEERPLAADVELRRVGSPTDAADYWRVAAAAYASIGFPPEIFAYYERHDGLSADNTVAFLAHLDGRPAAIAMTIVTGEVAGIYWVGVIEEARGSGLGRALTAAAVNAGFELGAELASLQASPMGEPVYRAMGFETVLDYRLYHCPAPATTT